MAIYNKAASGAWVGSTIYDTATISSGISPTGTITFRLFAPSDPACASPPVFTTGTTVSGGGYYQSATFAPTAAGTYHWTASYSGDANNSAAASSCTAPSAAVDVTKVRPNLTGSEAVSGKGATTVATAMLLGAGPTGTIVFNLYGPGNLTCTGSPVFSSSTAVAGNGTYSSAPFTATVAGSYRWVANYLGDANNEPAFTSCASSGGIVNLTGGVTLGASPGIVLASGILTVTWSGIATPSSTDWVGLYAVGAPDSAVRVWRYTTGTAGGSMTLKVRWNTPPGFYEVRLFAKNSYARLATPAAVTVV